MNDSLKEIIKEVIKDFFIITVAMLFVVSLANSIALIEYYPPYFPWVVMGTGAVTSIPTLLFYFKEEPTKLQARIRIVIHFCLIQAIVMTEGIVFDLMQFEFCKCLQQKSICNFPLIYEKVLYDFLYNFF